MIENIAQRVKNTNYIIASQSNRNEILAQ